MQKPIGKGLDASEFEKYLSLSDEELILVLGKLFEPELSRLQNASPTVESEDTVPVGDLGTNLDKTPSQLLYHKDYPEVNRTLVSLLALKWLLAGKYDRFVAHQPAATRLSRESFENIQILLHRDIMESASLSALAVITVLNDVGKDPTFGEDVIRHGGDLPAGYNHDDVVYAAAKADLLPSMDLLKPSLRADVLLGFKMGAKLNIPQLAQAENVPGSLKHVLIMRGYGRAFGLKFWEVLLDVAGAGGHVDARGCVAMTETVYQGLAVSKRALTGITNGLFSLREGYDQVLEQRRYLLGSIDTTHPSMGKVYDRTLLRLLTMGRVDNQEKAKLYKCAFDTLPESTRNSLCIDMNMDGTGDDGAVIPYYAPALFAEATKATNDSSDEKKVTILSSLMRFLARVYDQGRALAAETHDIMEWNLSFARDTITSREFLTNPTILDRLPFPPEWSASR